MITQKEGKNEEGKKNAIMAEMLFSTVQWSSWLFACMSFLDLILGETDQEHFKFYFPILISSAFYEG